ncbi:TetR/AcrR family transcriptional regulator [Streptomyces sp. NPDC026672]|uniref:TetR/AcrR family transcriptional regulator n=1 Tax=unclassified Streptomyces TaxID=2593676 RepID=UPI0033CFBF0E
MSRHQHQRSDAQHNRERILAAAREVLTQDGAASLNSIAKRAGVGPGTLYRNFPNREALVLEVFRSEMHKMGDLASELLATEPPVEALRLWFQRLASYIMIKRGLGDALTTARHDAVTSETYGPVTEAIGELLRAGEADGSIRPGLDPYDVLLMMGCTWRVAPGADGREQARRLLDLALDALRTRR